MNGTDKSLWLLQKQNFSKYLSQKLLGFLVVIFGILLPFTVIAIDREGEISLLHKRLEPTYFDRIYLKKGDIMMRPVSERGVGFSQHKLMFYHFWDMDCKPCINELPKIKELMATLAVYNIHSVYVVETIVEDRVRTFYKNQPSLFFEKADHYHTGDSGTRRILGLNTQPLSLLTDEKNVIRQAFVGSLQSRMSEVQECAKRFVDAVKARSKSP